MNITQMVRPESDTHPPLQASNRDCLGPPLSAQESDHDAVVDIRRVRDAADAPLPHRQVAAHARSAGRLDQAGAVSALPHTTVGSHRTRHHHGTSRVTRRTSSAVVCIPFRTTGERR